MLIIHSHLLRSDLFVNVLRATPSWWEILFTSAFVLLLSHLESSQQLEHEHRWQEHASSHSLKSWGESILPSSCPIQSANLESVFADSENSSRKSEQDEGLLLNSNILHATALSVLTDVHKPPRILWSPYVCLTSHSCPSISRWEGLCTRILCCISISIFSDSSVGFIGGVCFSSRNAMVFWSVVSLKQLDPSTNISDVFESLLSLSSWISVELVS